MIGSTVGTFIGRISCKGDARRSHNIRRPPIKIIDSLLETVHRLGGLPAKTKCLTWRCFECDTVYTIESQDLGLATSQAGQRPEPLAKPTRY